MAINTRTQISSYTLVIITVRTHATKDTYISYQRVKQYWPSARVPVFWCAPFCDKPPRTHTLTHAHALARTQAHAHIHMHAHTHTHEHARVCVLVLMWRPLLCAVFFCARDFSFFFFFSFFLFLFFSIFINNYLKVKKLKIFLTQIKRPTSSLYSQSPMN